LTLHAGLARRTLGAARAAVSGVAAGIDAARAAKRQRRSAAEGAGSGVADLVSATRGAASTTILRARRGVHTRPAAVGFTRRADAARVAADLSARASVAAASAIFGVASGIDAARPALGE